MIDSRCPRAWTSDCGRWAGCGWAAARTVASLRPRSRPILTTSMRRFLSDLRWRRCLQPPATDITGIWSQSSRLAGGWRRPRDRVGAGDAGRGAGGDLGGWIGDRPARTRIRAPRLRSPGAGRAGLGDDAAGTGPRRPPRAPLGAACDRARARGRAPGLAAAIASPRPDRVDAGGRRRRRNRPCDLPGVPRGHPAPVAVARRHALASGLDPPAGRRRRGPGRGVRGRAQLVSVALPLDRRLAHGGAPGRPERGAARPRCRRRRGGMARDLAAHARARRPTGRGHLGRRAVHRRGGLRLDLAAHARGAHAPERRQPRALPRRPRALQRLHAVARRCAPADPAGAVGVPRAAGAVAGRARARSRPERASVGGGGGDRLRVPDRAGGRRVLRRLGSRLGDQAAQRRRLAGAAGRDGRRRGVARAARARLPPLRGVRLDHPSAARQSVARTDGDRTRRPAARWARPGCSRSRGGRAASRAR